MATLVAEGFKDFNASNVTIGTTLTAGQTLVVWGCHRSADQGANPSASYRDGTMTFRGQTSDESLGQIADGTYRRELACWTYEGTGSETGSNVISLGTWVGTGISHGIYWQVFDDVDDLTFKDVYFAHSGEHSTNPTDATADVTTASLAANSFRVGAAAWKKSAGNPSDDGSIAWDNLTDATDSLYDDSSNSMHLHGGYLEDASSGAKTDTATLTASNTTSLGWVAGTVVWEPVGGDVTAPTYGSNPAEDSTDHNSTTCVATATDAVDATVSHYAIVVANDSDQTGLTGAQIEAGTDAGDAAALDSGSDLAVDNGVQASIVLDLAAPSTAYDVYWTCKDSSDNYATPQKIDVTSTAAPASSALLLLDS